MESDKLVDSKAGTLVDVKIDRGMLEDSKTGMHVEVPVLVDNN